MPFATRCYSKSKGTQRLSVYRTSKVACERLPMRVGSFDTGAAGFMESDMRCITRIGHEPCAGMPGNESCP